MIFGMSFVVCIMNRLSDDCSGQRPKRVMKRLKRLIRGPGRPEVFSRVFLLLRIEQNIHFVQFAVRENPGRIRLLPGRDSGICAIRAVGRRYVGGAEIIQKLRAVLRILFQIDKITGHVMIADVPDPEIYVFACSACKLFGF